MRRVSSSKGISVGRNYEFRPPVVEGSESGSASDCSETDEEVPDDVANEGLKLRVDTAFGDVRFFNIVPYQILNDQVSICTVCVASPDGSISNMT